ncbi:winged-helix domain-containing protein [Shewanella maritima]|uniref:winged helix-turn-helix transcriptional regulator n=1 Tax=Shewanella maritima TaxID=2520507 RepID=UPI003735AC8D
MKAILYIAKHSFAHTNFSQELASSEYDVTLVNNIFDGLLKLSCHQYQVILFDYSLSCRDLQLLVMGCKRAQTIVAIAHENTELEHLAAIEAGADQYLKAPFQISNLRQMCLGEMQSKPLKELIYERVLEFDESLFTIHFDGRELKLTRTEFRILHYLYLHRGKVVSKDELQLQILHKKHGQFDRNLDMHVSNTRRKISQLNLPRELINTVRGRGYCFSFPQADMSF